MTNFYKNKETGEIKPFEEISKDWTKGATTHKEANEMLNKGRELFHNEYEPVSEFHPLLAPYETRVILEKRNGLTKPVFILTNDFLIKHWEDHSIWDGCPHIINENVISCIQELKGAGKYPYNNDVGCLYCEKNGIPEYKEHSLLSAVVYCCQVELSNRASAQHEEKMIAEGWEKLSPEIAETAMITKKRLLLDGQVNNDWLTTSLSKDAGYRVIKDAKGEYFLISPGKKRRGYYLRNLVGHATEKTTFCKYSH